MNKTALSIITVSLVIGIGIIFLGDSRGGGENALLPPGSNVEIRDGIQYITIDAKGGYFPKVSSARANLPTKIIMKTNGTYDCSAALVIHSMGYQKILSQTGEETIDIGTPQAGTPLRGACSMGMYNFTINFS